jgi:uncharacterized protein YbcI
MSDSNTSSATGLRAEVSGSLGSVWKQYTGERPTDAETEIFGNRVRCVLTAPVGKLEDRLADGDATDGARDGRRLTESTFRRDAMAAVKKASQRKVVAFISDHDAKTGVATELFLLEGPPRGAITDPAGAGAEGA